MSVFFPPDISFDEYSEILPVPGNFFIRGAGDDIQDVQYEDIGSPDEILHVLP
jgi:hypothetical protein